MMSKGRTSVLLTGFGPFPTQPVNVTMKLAPQVAAEAQRLFPDIRVTTAILPTEWISAPLVLAALLDTHDPDVAIHFGISSRARGFEVEARGRNVCGDTEDASGCKPLAATINEGGPDHLQTNLPAKEIVYRLRQRGIPAFLSWDAGTYLCNALLYHTLEASRRRPTLKRNGFIHIPAALPMPGHAIKRSRRSTALTWPQAVDGSLEIIALCLGRKLSIAPHMRLRPSQHTAP